MWTNARLSPGTRAPGVDEAGQRPPCVAQRVAGPVRAARGRAQQAGRGELSEGPRRPSHVWGCGRRGGAQPPAGHQAGFQGGRRQGCPSPPSGFSKSPSQAGPHRAQHFPPLSASTQNLSPPNSPYLPCRMSLAHGPSSHRGAACRRRDCVRPSSLLLLALSMTAAGTQEAPRPWLWVTRK